MESKCPNAPTKEKSTINRTNDMMDVDGSAKKRLFVDDMDEEFDLFAGLTKEDMQGFVDYQNGMEIDYINYQNQLLQMSSEERKFSLQNFVYHHMNYLPKR